jgi:hypothetical protein
VDLPAPDGATTMNRLPEEALALGMWASKGCSKNAER